jgi:uncharacterized repeat protein (TIGR03837 family)
MLWDIFCKVIDNHGDIGVCWRLSAQLAARGRQVRLWVDDASALAWMAPGRNPPGVRVLPWDAQSAGVEPGDVVIEAFGCDPTPAFRQAIAAKASSSGHQPAWINLEYLTAESFAERSHGLPSPVLSGPAAGLTKHFFYPGFSPRTGGLLREDGLQRRQASFDGTTWLRDLGVRRRGEEQIVSLFCYEPDDLGPLLASWAVQSRPTRLLATAGRAAAAVRAAIEANDLRDPSWNAGAMLSMAWLPLLSQLDFDRLLWACDLNFVRGEDSLVRALWAGKPFVWQIYPQHDNAHQAKLLAFLDWLEAPPSMREAHLAWNGLGSGALPLRPQGWETTTAAARQRLWQQQDLASQLIRFAEQEKNR